MSDISAANQLTAGFYGLEENRWRWTAQTFSVLLETPPGADEKGGRLQVQLYVPDNQLRDLGPMKLMVDVDGHGLPPGTFAQEGIATYSRDVPAAALQSNLVQVTFTFDKAARPGNGDSRILGAVVSRVALASK
jgi:hypothetical protein